MGGILKYKLNKRIYPLADRIPRNYLQTAIFFVSLLVVASLATTMRSAINGHKAAYVTPSISILSPQANAAIATSSTFDVTANLSGASANDYDMFWYVDNGSWNWMGTTNDRQGNKQAAINVTNWTWHAPSKQYTIDLVAVMHNNGQRYYGATAINIGTTPAATTASSQPTTVNNTMTSQTAVATTALPTNLYVNPNSNAAQTAASTSDATTKRIMTKLAATPTAYWFGDWSQNVQSDVAAVTTAASAANNTPVLVAYNIPDRDCNGYSSGGAANTATYQTWIKDFAAGIGSHSAIIILEPDATAQATCLSSGDQSTRYQLLQFAINTLKVNPNAKVYLDAGNPTWVTASDMAQRLNSAGISKADGFSLNVSNFITTSDNITYGHQVSALVGDKHFVIDTSRNGNGSNGQWCNPSGRALGSTPTANTGDKLVDYLLWIKTPGESDGSCNGGPAAGVWWPAYAVTLGQNASW